MTLDQSYQAHQGQAILIPGGGTGNNGQCAQWADTVLHEVYGLPYIYTPGAIDWYLKTEQLGLSQKFDRVSDGSIKKGDFVVYGTGVGSEFGHIDVAAQDGTFKDYVGYDSNWGGKAFYNAQGFPILHTVHHNDSYNRFILGVLRLKGGTDMPLTAAQLDKLIKAFKHADPTSAELNDPNYKNNPGLAIDTFYNIWGLKGYNEDPNAAQAKLDEIKNIVNK